MHPPRVSPGRWTAVLALLLVGASSTRAQSSKDERAEDAARAAKWLQSAFRGQTTPEAAEMLIAIAKGSRMGPGEGWFHPGQSRYGWKWLADKHCIKLRESIPRTKFAGPEALFA